VKAAFLLSWATITIPAVNAEDRLGIRVSPPITQIITEQS